MVKVLITTVPFGERDRLPLEMLEEAGIDYLINPTDRKLSEAELTDLVGDFDALIAGTEPITDRVLSRAPNLRLISRVGIGLDSVDLLAAERRNVLVCYTPDAPAPAVSEFTIGLMFCLLRSVQVANAEMHAGLWRRHFGRRLAEVTVGIIGVGRIGTRVIRSLQGFGPPRILANDIEPNPELERELGVNWVPKDTVYQEADIITLHLPLTALTRNLISTRELEMMKPEALLINTSRGGIVKEEALHLALKRGQLGGAALDVFEQEPYRGPLAQIERCLLTAHMGSMSVDCRVRMEQEATKDIVRFFTGQPLQNRVPASEYDLQRGRQKPFSSDVPVWKTKPGSLREYS